jgi:hypothetical protein
MRRQRHDRGTGSAGLRFESPDRPRRLEPVHLRHVAIHEHDIVAAGLECFDRLCAVIHRARPRLQAGQRFGDHLAVDRTVISHQDFQARDIGERRTRLRAGGFGERGQGAGRRGREHFSKARRRDRLQENGIGKAGAEQAIDLAVAHPATQTTSPVLPAFSRPNASSQSAPAKTMALSGTGASAVAGCTEYPASPSTASSTVRVAPPSIASTAERPI